MVGVDSASGGGSESTDLPEDVSYDIQPHADEPERLATTIASDIITRCRVEKANTVARAHVTW
jgi:hypothetical protein